MLADSASPHGLAYRFLGGYIVPRASHRAVTGSACLGRERLMEQPVSSGEKPSCETETQATFRSHKNTFCQIDCQNRNLVHGLGLLYQLSWFNTLILVLCTARPQRGGMGPYHYEGFSCAIRRISARSSAGIGGRP